MSVTTETRSEVTIFPSRRSIERLEEKSFVVLDVEEATGRPRLVAALHVAPNPRIGLFVANNPVNWIDPFGLEKQCTDWMFDKDLSSTTSPERREERPGAWTRVGLPMQTNLVRGVFTRLVQRWQRIIAIFGIQNITTVSQYRRYCVDECGNGEWEYSTDTDVKTNERFIKNRTEHKDTYSTSGPFMGPGGAPPMPSP